MATSGAVLQPWGALGSFAPNNLGKSITRAGVSPASALPARTQQGQIVAQDVVSVDKGKLLRVTVSNTATSGAAQAFLMFDVCGIAAANGVAGNGANISYSTSFAGGGTSTMYEALRNSIQGTRIGAIGAQFQFSVESAITTSGLKIWNGNYENYNSASFDNYLQLAKDNYANNQKVLNMDTNFYINNFFAIGGTLNFGESITILFNVAALRNF